MHSAKRGEKVKGKLRQARKWHGQTVKTDNMHK